VTPNATAPGHAIARRKPFVLCGRLRRLGGAVRSARARRRAQGAGRGSCGARPSLREGFPAVLGLVARRVTRFVHCVHCARTDAASQFTKRATGVAQALASRTRQSEATSSEVEPYPGFHTSYADIDGDGNTELLVQMPTGAYGSVLLVYGMKDWEFQKLGELYSTTIGGFEVADIDGDGRLEGRTDEIAKRPDLPYVAGLRDQVTHRFDSGSFFEVDRVEHWTEEEMQKLKREFGQ
jgi:hypothetical protein